MRFMRKLGLWGMERLVAAIRPMRKDRKELPEHLQTGFEGEDAAYFYLSRKGYRMMARRWRTESESGDLDLVAWQGETLCFVEVKTRTARDAFPAESLVDSEKRSILRKMARAYLLRLPSATQPLVRFDILSVYLLAGGKKEFVHFENAFGWSEADAVRWGDRW